MYLAYIGASFIMLWFPNCLFKISWNVKIVLKIWESMLPGWNGAHWRVGLVLIVVSSFRDTQERLQKQGYLWFIFFMETVDNINILSYTKYIKIMVIRQHVNHIRYVNYSAMPNNESNKGKYCSGTCSAINWYSKAYLLIYTKLNLL